MNSLAMLLMTLGLVTQAPTSIEQAASTQDASSQAASTQDASSQAALSLLAKSKCWREPSLYFGWKCDKKEWRDVAAFSPNTETLRATRHLSQLRHSTVSS